MNREIKFRAWDKEDKKWIESVIVHSNGQFTNKGAIWLNHRAELMQFTGRKDKNGKEIYEGDLMKAGKEGSIWEVVWNENKAQYELIDPTTYRDMSFCEYIEVIGNIYENPELLTPNKS